MEGEYLLMHSGNRPTSKPTKITKYLTLAETRMPIQYVHMHSMLCFVTVSIRGENRAKGMWRLGVKERLLAKELL